MKLGKNKQIFNSDSLKKRPISNKKTLKRIFSYIMEYKLKFLIVVFFAIISTIFSIVGPKIMGNATTEIFNGVINKILKGGNGVDFDKILKFIIILIILYTASSIFLYLQSYIMTGIAQKISYNLRKQISEKINNMPMKYFDNTSRGDILSRVSNDVDTLSQTLNQSMMQFFSATITIIGVLAMMLSINVFMTVVGLIIVPLAIGMVMGLIKKSQGYFVKQQKYLGELNGQIEESFSGQNIITLYNASEFEINKFEQINNKLYNTAWKSQFISSIMQPLMGFIGNLGYVIVSIVGGYMVVKGKMKIGDIQAFVQYMRSFTQPLNTVAQITNLLQSTSASAERVFEFLDEDEIQDNVEKQFDVKKCKGEIEFKNINFGYEEESIIKDFSLKVKPGQKIAIVGPTGSGKTTLVKLLMRFYDVDSGKIMIDGIDIKKIDREKYRKLFAMVFQDTWLFNGTIKDNIKYAKLDATDEDLYLATKTAYADHFISLQQDGYETILNEGVDNISQGQKQLLTIARAILANPKILILDEATSSVDTRTEKLIQKAMDNLIENRTSFIIAHRLSTIKNADLILVLKDGNIVESGKHNELILKKGFYEQLYNSQFEK